MASVAPPLGAPFGLSMLSRWTALVVGYVVAIAAVAASLLLRYSLHGSLGQNVPYLQFFPAVILAAWFGGLGPGLVATAISALAAAYFFLPPAGFAVGAASDQLSLGIFIGSQRKRNGRPPRWPRLAPNGSTPFST